MPQNPCSGCTRNLDRHPCDGVCARTFEAERDLYCKDCLTHLHRDEIVHGRGYCFLCLGKHIQ